MHIYAPRHILRLSYDTVLLESSKSLPRDLQELRRPFFLIGRARSLDYLMQISPGSFVVTDGVIVIRKLQH